LKVCAVIVTYGDRFHLLKQVMDACYKEGVSKIIVVDNNSSKNSKIELKKYENEHKDRLKVIYLDENTGSAGGFKRGLQEAYNDNECEFIWLLDDDNMPQKDSLKVLENFWNNLNQEDKNEKVALLSYRNNAVLHKKVIEQNNYSLLLGKQNSFLKLHFLEIPKRIFNLIKKRFVNENKFYNKLSKDYGRLPLSPYGGMFFNKSIIDKIRYPNDKLFLYSDDYDWSYRITNDIDGKIYLIINSKISDLDESWMIGDKPTIIFKALLNRGSDFRVYYSIRNRIIFEKNYLEKNKFIYKINLFLFLFLLRLFVNRNNLKRFSLIKEAIRDGLDINLKRKKF
jgi:GT2 family glycosyltransferase